MAYSRILVPVEYSESCRAALEVAGLLAERFGAALDVVHVWDKPSYVADDLAVMSPTGHRSLIELIREGAEQEMTAFLAKARLPASVRVESHLESGEPAHAILELLKRRGVDLVVVSTHGRTGFRHFLMGSIAERLVRSSPVPVLTVPAKAARA